jgi:hypothetical protein
MVNAALIGNCQATALVPCLARNREIKITHVADVNVSHQDGFRKAVFDIHNKDGIDLILSQQISDQFDDISTNRLSVLYINRYFSFTNIYFGGLHPDLSYYGNFKRRIESPLGDYHSKIALICFLKKMTIAECINMYRGKVYEKLGYFNVYEESMNELERRDENNSVRFASKFRDMTKNTLTMLSVNHPTNIVLASLATAIVQGVSSSRDEMHPDFFSNGLSSSVIFPVYPEVSEQHHLHYRTPMLFYPHSSVGGNMTLVEFVESSFKMYSDIGYDEMASVELGKILFDIDLI